MFCYVWIFFSNLEEKINVKKLTCLVLSTCILNTSIQIRYNVYLTLQCQYSTLKSKIKNVKATKDLKSLGPIDRKFHGHGENDEFVLYEYIIKQCSSFCKYTNSVVKKNVK